MHCIRAIEREGLPRAIEKPLDFDKEEIFESSLYVRFLAAQVGNCSVLASGALNIQGRSTKNERQYRFSRISCHRSANTSEKDLISSSLSE